MRHLSLFTLLIVGLFASSFSIAQEEQTVEIKKNIIINGDKITTDTCIKINGQDWNEITEDMNIRYIESDDSLTLFVNTRNIQAESDNKIHIEMNVQDGKTTEVYTITDENAASAVFETFTVDAIADESGEIQVFYSEAKDGKEGILLIDVRIEDITDFDIPNELVENSLLNENIDFYPNPNNGIFTLNFSSQKEETIQLSIFDSSGRQVYEKTIEGKTGQVKEDIDLAKFWKGTYILSVKQGKDFLSKKVIVN